jgi:AraC-like DNA-binding protein
MLFFISEDFIRRFVKTHGQITNSYHKKAVSKNQIFPIDVNDSLNALFISVFNYMNQSNNIPKDLVEMKFNELLYNIALNPLNKDLINYFSSLQQIEKANLDTIMMKNFHCDLNLEEFARLTGRSLSKFKRNFKEYYNETPGKWINNKRIEYAKTLLENPELNINDICFESGFKNASHFNSSFKEKYELPPNQYRKQVLNP